MFRFGPKLSNSFLHVQIWPRESKRAMMYSDTGRLNCNVSYATFAMPIRGQVLFLYSSHPSTFLIFHDYHLPHIFKINLLLPFISFPPYVCQAHETNFR